MKKLLCMILAVSMGTSILPVTAMAAEETDYYTGTVEIEDAEEQDILESFEDTEEQDILESFEETEVAVEDMEQDQQELAEEEILQVQTIEGEYIYHPFSLELGAKAKLNLFEDEAAGEYFLEEDAEYSDALEYTSQGDESAEKYINRITIPVFAEEFYESLEEAVDGDGNDDYLMDPSYYSFSINKDGFKVISTKDEYGNDVTRIVYTVVEDIKLKAGADEEAVVKALYDAATKTYSAFDRDHPEVFWLQNEMGLLTRKKITYSADQYGNKVEGSETYYYYLYFSLASDKGGNVSQIRSDEFLDEDGEYISIGGEIFYDMNDVAEYPYQLAEQIRDSFDASEDDYAYDGTGPDFREEYNISAGVTFDDLTDAGKVAYFDYWLTRNADYNTDVAVGYETTLSSPYECVSALWAEGGSEGPVCEGYARAMKLLCEMENIGCVLVTGDSGPRFDGKDDHMWNYVEVDGKWYAQDTTWNDPVNADPRTGYLLVGSDTFETDHHWMNLGHNDVAFPEGPELEEDNFPFECKWMVQNAVEASVDNESVEIKIYPTRLDVTESVAEDDIVMLVAAIYDQTDNRLLDVKTTVCLFGEMDAWTAELSAGDKTDLGYKVFLINTENHGPIMKQIAEIL